MPSYILTDTAEDIWVEALAVNAAELGLQATPPWSVAKRTLRGGRREGVDLVEVDNAALSFAVIPTRGMGLWKGRYRRDAIGWGSPVADGPVNPAFVNLSGGGGLGWLDGFDELLVRCGLENNGAPYAEDRTVFGLHGRIANIPAHYVAVHIGDRPPHEITVEGHVDEARLFGPRIRMTTRIMTTPGSNRLVVRDEIVNRKDSPGEIQLLYHWNFGPPHLEAGARLVAPTRTVAPRDPRAQEGIGHYDVYAPPEPGYTEQVYFFELLGEGPEGRTLAMLRNREGDKAVVLRFAKEQLPAFTLWKNTGGLKEGYVTGLEPATNYPNPKPIEKERKRVVPLAPGGRFVAETVFEVLDNKAAVAAVEAEIEAIQKQGVPTIHSRPVEPFSPASELP